MNGTTESKIAGIPQGKTFSNRADDTFIHVRRTQAGFEIECGWVVSESYDDDADSYTYHPFRTNTPRPWVGRKMQAQTSGQAAEIYERWLQAIHNRQSVTDGAAIGSVSR